MSSRLTLVNVMLCLCDSRLYHRVQVAVVKEQSDWFIMELQIQIRVGWKFVLMDNGALCVVMDLLMTMGLI